MLVCVCSFTPGLDIGRALDFTGLQEYGVLKQAGPCLSVYVSLSVGILGIFRSPVSRSSMCVCLIHAGGGTSPRPTDYDIVLARPVLPREKGY